MTYRDLFGSDEIVDRPPDPAQERARRQLEQFFAEHSEKVFFSRQLEVHFEDRYFHWVTNRALRELVGRDVIRTEPRQLGTGGSISLLWNRRYRYYKRAAKHLISLVEEYANPNVGAAVGLHGEAMVLEGFARSQFVLRDRDSRSYRGLEWQSTQHDLDFVFERDGIAYGVEVKNTLGYMDHGELTVKLQICRALGLRAVVVARMLPKVWIHEIGQLGGFALVLKYQLYPWGYRELARRVESELGLPVDSPRRLEDATMERFLQWHRRAM